MLIIKGVPGSPYTRKMLSLLRFRHIPYRYVQQGNSPLPGLPEPKVSLLPVVYLTDQEGECEALVDSTPIIRRLEADYPGRSCYSFRPGASLSRLPDRGLCGRMADETDVSHPLAL